MNTAHLQPDFDPSTVRIADLRGILVEHLVPFSSVAKKADLVALYEEKIRPRASRLLAEREKVRASSVGIEDHRKGAAAASGSDTANSRRGKAKKPLAAPALTPAAETGMTSTRKSMSMGNLAAIASGTSSSSKSSGRRSSALPTSASSTSLATATGSRRTGMRRSASVEVIQDSQDDEDQLGLLGDDDAAVAAAPAIVKRGRGRPRKNPVVSQAPAMPSVMEPGHSSPERETGEMEIDEPATKQQQQQQRKTAPPTPSTASRRQSTGVFSPGGRSIVEVVVPESRRKTFGGETAEAGQKRKAKNEATPSSSAAVAETGFSDYNPFQSGDDASPDGEEKKKKRRRKSSLGPSAMQVDENDPEPSLGSMKRSSTMQALGSGRHSLGGENSASASAKKFPSSASSSRIAGIRDQFEKNLSPPPVPAIPSAYTPSFSFVNPNLAKAGSSSASPAPSSSSKGGMASSKSVPSFQRYMAPLESLKTPPEDFRLLVRQAEQKQIHNQQEQPASARATRTSTRSTSNSQVAPPAQSVPDLSEEDQQMLEELAGEDAQEGPASAEQNNGEAMVATQDETRVSPPKAGKRGPAPPSSSSKADQQSSASRALISRRARPVVPKSVQLIGLLLPLLTIFGGYSTYWAEQKRDLGFCNTDSVTNGAVVARQGQFDHFSDTFKDGSVDWSALGQDLQKTLTPTTCEACPPHAICEDGQVKACKRDYILQPNALAYLFGDGVDPKQSITSILFRPSCRPDTERLVRVAETATQIAGYLRQHRGEIVCNGEEKARIKAAKRDKSGKPEEWSVYGASEDWLKKVIQERRNPKILDSQFDDVFEEALQDLIGHNEVVYGIDSDAESWVASHAADMPFSCRTRLAAYRAADEHKTSLASVFGVLLTALYARLKLAEKKRISEQVDELVPIALQLLQQQEQNHHIDNVLHPYPYLAPSQLRDLVLAHEHSPARRAELWKRVEKIVEGNSNVRAKIAEQHGEELRVWQWVGGAYYIEDDQVEAGYGGDADGQQTEPTSVVRRRKSYGALGPRSSLSKPGTPRPNTPARHITWGKDVKSSPTASQQQ